VRSENRYAQGGEKVDATNAKARTRPFSLGIYLLIVFGLSWPFQIVSAIWAAKLLLIYTLNSLSMIMVTVGTLIAGRYVFGDGFAQAGWSWGKAKHYLAVIGLVMLLWIVPTLASLILGNIGLPGSLTGRQLAWVCVLLFITLIPGFGEEFGWRGYMLPHLARRMTARKAVFLHAVIWWIWHWPILIGAAVHASVHAREASDTPLGLSVALSIATVLLMGAIPAIMHGVVFAYIWSRSRSLAVATVYHGTYDGVRDSLGITIGLGSLATLWASGVLSILGAIFLWKDKWTNIEKAGAQNKDES